MILNNINWEVKKGQNWIILGANGSGKSSLLNALTAYMSPSAGNVFMCGQQYGKSNWPELRKQIGMVSHSIQILINKSEPVRDVILSGCDAMLNRYDCISEAKLVQLESILKVIGSQSLANQLWGTLSQGEKQRVLIGRALMSKLQVLILDEPCIGLDPVVREHFLAFVTSLSKKPETPTIILVTHHVEEIIPVFSHVLILKDGQILAQGSKDDVLNSENLTQAFDSNLTLSYDNQRYALKIQL